MIRRLPLSRYIPPQVALNVAAGGKKGRKEEEEEEGGRERVVEKVATCLTDGDLLLSQNGAVCPPQNEHYDLATRHTS